MLTSTRGSRFGKNFIRIDNELRAEGKDCHQAYHQRQPYAVTVAMIFLPEAACLDGSEKTPSSFGSAVRQFRYRANRRNPSNEEERFERIFIGWYADTGARRGETWLLRDVVATRRGCYETWFLDVMTPPPRNGRPIALSRLDFSEVLDEIARTYDFRNDPPFEWASEADRS